jgi:hypothetical protein
LATRRTNSPWGSSYKEGLPSRAVDSNVNVDQNVRATITTGVIDVATGQWQGITVSDPQMIPGATAEGIANTGDVLFPGTANAENIDMTGYSDIFIALKPTNGGNYAISAVQGNDTQGGFAGLTPLASARTLRGNRAEGQIISDALIDSAEDCQSDLWNVFFIGANLRGQKNMQFKVTNNSGGISTIEFAFMRVV